MNFNKLFLTALSVIFSVIAYQTDAAEKHKIKEINDIPYYENPKPDSNLTKLNLVIPNGLDSMPVFMWVGGGAWAYVDRNREMDLCRKFAERGILMVSVGHRLSPQLLGQKKNPEGIQHPEHVRDLAKAFKWVYENIEKYGGSKDNIFVGGYSSGAQLSALLASDKKYLEEAGLTKDIIKGIIPVAGGYDIPEYRDLLVKEDPSFLENHINVVFGKGEINHIDASPVTYIDDFNTPMLLISEGETYIYSKSFENLLNEREYKEFTALNFHSETHSSLWTKLSNDENCIFRDYIIDYIHELKNIE